MATQKELKQLESIVSHNIRFYYSVDKNGNKVLRHILVGTRKNLLAVPDEDITIDVVPENSVGSEQIADGSIQLQDLSDDVKEQMKNEFATDDEVKAQLGL